MLAGFPDYGKSPPEYLATIAKVMANYPRSIQERIADYRSGIPAKCKFLPTVADIVEMADKLEASRDKYAKYENIRRRPVLALPATKFCPFPTLWEAFKDEPDLVFARPFDELFDAAAALAKYGKGQARIVLGGLSA